MFDLRRITLHCLEKRLSKHKMTAFSKIFGGQSPFGPPDYAYTNNKQVIFKYSMPLVFEASSMKPSFFGALFLNS